MGAPNSGAVEECAPVAGSMEGAENEGGTSGPVSGKSQIVEPGTGVNAHASDESREGGKTSKGGDGNVHATEASRGDRVSTGGKKGSDDVKGKEPPATLLRELFLCAALLPLSGVKHKTKKGKLVSAAHSVVSDSLKVPLCFDLYRGYQA